MFAIALLLAHGFYKACLFLDAGSVMHSMNDEVNMRRFGGLARYMPITYVTFGISYLAIAGIPPFSGFFTKDPIIGADFGEHGHAGWILGICALIGAGITGFYITRMLLMTWQGKPRWAQEVPAERRDAGASAGAGTAPADEHAPAPHPHESPPVMTFPLIVLAIGAAAPAHSSSSTTDSRTSSPRSSGYRRSSTASSRFPRSCRWCWPW